MADNREFFQIDLEEAMRLIEEAIAQVNEDAEVAQREYLERIRSRNRNLDRSHTKEQQKQYRERNKEKHKEASRKRYDMKKDEIKEQHKQYREMNKDKVAAAIKLAKQENREKYRAKAKQRYYERNKAQRLEYNKQHRELNLEKLSQKQMDKRQNTPKTICEVCGGSYALQHRTTHMRTQKHRLALELCQVVEEIWSY